MAEMGPKKNTTAVNKAAREEKMSNSQPAPGVVGPFAGLDVPWLLRMRAETRGDHPFLIWAPFDAPARIWPYGEFHERVGSKRAGSSRANSC
jgi:crotonobetaine/carnitine-CoA ligase